MRGPAQPPHHDRHRPRRADPLGNGARRGDARHAQRRHRPEAANEQRIEHDVDRIERQRDPQRRAHVLLAAQHAEGNQQPQHRRRAQQPHVHVLDGVAQHVALSAQRAGDRFVEQIAHGHDRQPEEARQRQRHAHDARGAPLLTRTQRLRHIRLRADAQEVEGPEDAGERGRAHAQRSQRRRAELRHKGGVDQTGQRFCYQREQHRRREKKHCAVRVTGERVTGTITQCSHLRAIRVWVGCFS